MDLSFELSYHTRYGEQLVLHVFYADHKGNERTYPYKMTTTDGERWVCRMQGLPLRGCDKLQYFYAVEVAGYIVREEWKGCPHVLDLKGIDTHEVVVHDRWQDMPGDAYLYSSAITDCIMPRKGTMSSASKPSVAQRIVVRAPQLGRGQSLYLVGAHACLGDWCPQNGLCMTEQGHNLWYADINGEDSSMHGCQIEYKFVIIDHADMQSVVWERGENRTIILPDAPMRGWSVYDVGQADFEVRDIKLAGTLIPVFSLRSEGSFGVGDFGDLMQMIDLMQASGQHLLQILPVNDTTSTHTWSDSYPYSCISVFALHPQYVDLRQLPPLRNKNRMRHYESLRVKLNACEQVDYDGMMAAKEAYLHEIYLQEGRTVLDSKGFKSFFDQTAEWLVPYARYCHYRDLYGTGDFMSWPDHQTWDESERRSLSLKGSPDYESVAYHYYVQYVLDSQLRRAHEYARDCGVILKGDIPIGVSRQGCDVWMEPHYFNLDGQAGAPPDAFSEKGQNWGFPTYDWDEMLKDGCRWWERRFKNMARFFDAYRIDHVLGFFRIWEIPISSVDGLLGRFSPALGLTAEEIQIMGLHFDEKSFTQPYITDAVLTSIFGSDADTVRQHFLIKEQGEGYRLREEVDTQRKIRAKIETMPIEDKNRMIDGLDRLVNNVLFVADGRETDKWHPRISAQQTTAYQRLTDEAKNVFDRIYNNYFYVRNNHFWYLESMKKLPRLAASTRMLVCAEDLGMVPESVAWTLGELGIFSLEIQNMPKDIHVRFGDLKHNPYKSVSTFSTHDMPTLRQWWEQDKDAAQFYYNTILCRGGQAPHPMPGWVAEDIVIRHLEGSAMLCVLSLQDWLAISEDMRAKDMDTERINIPADPNHYWRYRMHLTISQLMHEGDFLPTVRRLIERSGRNT